MPRDALSLACAYTQQKTEKHILGAYASKASPKLLDTRKRQRTGADCFTCQSSLRKLMLATAQSLTSSPVPPLPLRGPTLCNCKSCWGTAWHANMAALESAGRNDLHHSIRLGLTLGRNTHLVLGAGLSNTTWSHRLPLLVVLP